MARCGCSADRCTCNIEVGNGATISGTGSASNPYIISFSGFASTNITGVDSDTIDITITGEGTLDEPYEITADCLHDLTVTDTNTLDLTITGDGTPWVLSGVAKIEAVASNPGTPYEGQLIYRTDTDFWQGYDGAAWRVLQSEKAWTAVSGGIGFSNSWVNFGGTNQVAEYRRCGDMVQIRGLIKDGTVNTAAFTLPAGFRPPADLLYASTANNAFARLDILPSGQVIPAIGSNVSFAINVEFSVTA